MDLLSSFWNFIATEHLFGEKDRLLVAVSGGMDSVVLCECCHQSGLDFVIAHCNFQLRGDESDRDETFVRQLANKYNRELLVRRMDTKAYADQHRLSIQVAARELRYNWFREITARHADPQSSALQWILTAHHLDDNIETLLMNFFKGTGIAGLRGILPRQGNVVRPLLFAGKEQLSDFAQQHQLSWVEDSSNASDKYTRNYFRHRVIPL
ncbi:MAG: tRNA lysidine(34) synthetase TilS, partial [Bacteroidota bacterium]